MFDSLLDVVFKFVTCPKDYDEFGQLESKWFVGGYIEVISYISQPKG